MTSQKTSEPGQATGTRFKDRANSRQRILVVDDDGDIRRLSAEVLGSSGYHVDVAEDGAIAWDALKLNAYDLLLTDYKMPNVTGIELVQKLHAAHMTIPVIMASGTLPTNELNWHPGVHIDALLPKPYTSEELLGTVKKVLNAAGEHRQTDCRAAGFARNAELRSFSDLMDKQKN